MSALVLVTVLALAAAEAPAKKNSELVAELSNVKTSQPALEELVKRGAVNDLIGAAVEGKDMTARGWGIVGLSRVGGKEAAATLKRLTDDGKQPMLVRTWAAAGQIESAKSFTELAALSNLPTQFPACQRPFGLRAQALVRGGNIPVEDLLKVSVGNYQLQPMLVPAILASGADPLVKAMVHAKDQNVRQQAAAYLGTLAQQQGKAGNELVGGAVVRAYQFKPGATEVPWAGGPLYVPNIGWDKTMARQLVGALIAWYVWGDAKGDAAVKSQTANNLNSISLGGVLGYSAQFQDQGAKTWLSIWRNIAGKEGVKDMLTAQHLENDSRYMEATR